MRGMMAMNCPQPDRYRRLPRGWRARRVVEATLGGHVFAERGEIVSATAGAALCVCVRERALGIGGITHFLLAPELTESFTTDTAAPLAMRLGNLAMEHLLTSIQKRGGARSQLEVMAFGAAPAPVGLHAAAAESVAFLHAYCAMEGLLLVREDLGGEEPRRIGFAPQTGTVQVLAVTADEAREVALRELAHLANLRETPAQDDIELF
jgi:chemotaxis protein CheD